MVSALTSLLLNTPGNISQSRKGGAGDTKTAYLPEPATPCRWNGRLDLRQNPFHTRQHPPLAAQQLSLLQHLPSSGRKVAERSEVGRSMRDFKNRTHL